ncbi:hypothetical protein TNCV_2738401 [Trichonephila clavipes]|nr:hypothetical protein TNCV_2738401 [Trichonephila clavipes]
MHFKFVETQSPVVSVVWKFGEWGETAQFPCRDCGGSDRGGVAIYRPFGEFRQAKSYCHLSTRAIGDGARSFEPRSCDEDDTLADIATRLQKLHRQEDFEPQQK